MSEIFETYPGWIEFLRVKGVKIFEKYSLPRWIVFIQDGLSVFIIFYLAYLLRFNFAVADVNFRVAFVQGLMTLCVYSAFSIIFRSYSGLIRHTTLTDISQVFIVTTTSASVLLLLSLAGRHLYLSEKIIVPVSIILIHYVSVSIFLFSIRILIKLIFKFVTNPIKERKHVLIYGAGEMGFVVKRVISSDPNSCYSVFGFLDNNKQLQGKKINNLPVFNPNILSTNFLKKHRVSTLVFAILNMSPKIKSDTIHTAIDLGLEILETPSVDRWLDGKFQVSQLHKVKLEDLLGRDPIKLNLELISKGLNNKIILVTGAAGSIGSEIVRQLARFNTGKIILIDQAETPLFHLENELREKYTSITFQPILADVTSAEKMESIFIKFKPDIVFHAAAYKHVPLMEENPHEAFRVNIIGTLIITNLSQKYNAQKFVMISTDKSVNPSSVMGASKRICEYIVQSRAKVLGVNTQFVITRFGNVLGSNGSVVPLFTKQIEYGGPVTVTHPDITRFFMTIPEACQLVLEAGFMGKGGEIFVFDMGKPVRILDLAKNMIRLSGFEPDKDIKIAFTGLRPGEKLYEEVLSEKENTLPTHHPKIKIASVENKDHKFLISRIINLYGNLYSLSGSDVVDFFSEIVPEFKSTNENYAQISEKVKSTESEKEGEDILIQLPVGNDDNSLSRAL